jgi:23S rRNA (uridine2552-2'-O)-methyltransferase
MTSSREEFLRKRNKEGFYKQSKELNVRARSYFKLEQLDNKFKLINENMKIIDLGCAPGGWLEYMDKKLEGKKSEIIGIDLLEIKKQSEFSSKIEIIEDDFNNIEDYHMDKFDLVLSDMAPEFSGDSVADRGRCHKLNVLTIEFCERHLKPHGRLVFKTFGGEDLDWVRSKAKKLFKEIKEYKPTSSQGKSAELFIFCDNKI